MIYNGEQKGSGNMDINAGENNFCSISLFTKNQSFSQNSQTWKLNQENCICYCNNYKIGYAYMDGKTIKIRGDIEWYIIFFK